jgi:hypothetical protein
MNKIPDDTHLITKEMSEILHNRLFSYSGSKTMTDSYLRIIETEPNCKDDINMLVNAYTKVIITTMIASIMQNSQIDDQFILKLSEPIKKLIQNSFGAGVIYTKAKMEQDFLIAFKGSLDEELNIAFDEALLMEEECIDGNFFEPEDDDDGDITIR